MNNTSICHTSRERRQKISRAGPSIARSTRCRNLQQARKFLPIHASRRKLIDCVYKNQVTVLTGETGSGKTTQVAQYLVEAGFAAGGKRVCCTQPRRIAAISVAKRVAQEMDVPLGRQVGYNVRFDNATSKNTRLIFQTDGVLLREAMNDPLFSAYSVIVIDEAHERTVSTDLLMGVLKDVVQKRNDLRVIIMSATMDTASFQAYFKGAPLISVSGRTFPVDIVYTTRPVNNYVDTAVNRAIDICKNESPGDVLIFLTGEDEIKDACHRIQAGTRAMSCGPVEVYPLYGALSPEIQQRVFKPAPRPIRKGGPSGRKVIVATNIAETSLTIDGVVYVIDAGLAKQKVYNPRARADTLLIDTISKAAAKQRMGRAGRTRRGKCYRLYTEEAFDKELPISTYPEILRCNMSNVVLQMLALGIYNPVKFDFLDPPAPESMMRAFEALYYLNAIDGNGQLTKLGSTMACFPLQPEAAAALIKSASYECSEEMLTIVSMLSEAPNCFVSSSERGGGNSHNGRMGESGCARERFQDPHSDHLTYLGAYNVYKKSAGSGKRAFDWCKRNGVNARAMKAADHVRRQLAAIMRSKGLPLLSSMDNRACVRERIGKALIAGFFMQVAYRTGEENVFETYKDNELVQVHSTSGVDDNATWLVYHEYMVSDRSNSIRTCTEVLRGWLEDVAPGYFT